MCWSHLADHLLVIQQHTHLLKMAEPQAKVVLDGNGLWHSKSSGGLYHLAKACHSFAGSTWVKLQNVKWRVRKRKL
jgi:hypothetical protein